MSCEPYLELFRSHGLDRGAVYMDAERDAEEIFALFDAVSERIVGSDPCSVQLPAEFIESMRRYNRGDAATVAHFDRTEHRAFYLSDLYDYIRLFCSKK